MRQEGGLLVRTKACPVGGGKATAVPTTANASTTPANAPAQCMPADSDTTGRCFFANVLTPFRELRRRPLQPCNDGRVITSISLSLVKSTSWHVVASRSSTTMTYSLIVVTTRCADQSVGHLNREGRLTTLASFVGTGFTSSERAGSRSDRAGALASFVGTGFACASNLGDLNESDGLGGDPAPLPRVPLRSAKGRELRFGSAARGRTTRT